MSSPAEVVAEQFSNATAYVNESLERANTFIDALGNAIYTTPLTAVTWQAIDPPSPVTVPDAPAQLDTILGTLEWDQDGTIASSKPDALDVAAPVITIDDFNDTPPTLDIPDTPTLDFGDQPVVDYGTKPTAPTVNAVSVPSAPSITLPDTPSYLTLETPSFAGLDLHADLQPTLTDLPTLTLAAPTPYTYTPSAAYTSTLLTNLKTVLTARLAGGTGLNASVEQAIWDRARSREAALGAKNEAEVTRTHEAMGFHLPTGAFAAQLRAAQQDTVDRISSLSRDISIKQADLEQANLEKTIAAGMELEGKLIDYSYNMERLAFETAKEVAANAIAVHNAGVEKYRALLDYYRVFREAYLALIEGEKLKLEEYRGLLQAEQTKAEVNRTLVEQFKAQIEGEVSLIRLFEGQLQGAKVLLEIEQAKVATFGEEVRAYAAGVNGETAKVEGYKINAEAQKIKADVTESLTRAQLSRVELYKATAQAFQAKAGAQGEKARAQIAYYEGVVRAKTAEFEGWSARIRGESERFRAITSMSNAVLDSFKARAEVVLKTADQDISRWQVGIKQYEAQQNYTLAVQKINTDVIQHNQQATLDAKKAGAQILAQLTSSAMGMIHTSAGVSASASDSVGYSYSIGYSYSNDTSATVAPQSFTPITTV